VLSSPTRDAVVRQLRSRSPRRDDSGAAAVEFALVASLLIILVFGIIEFSLVMRDVVSLGSASRTAARIASAEAGAGPCSTGCASGTPASVPKLAQDAADAIQRAGLAMPKDSIDELWVFRVAPGANGLPPTSCTSGNSCVRFRWVDSNDRFTYQAGGWNSTSIAACVGTDSNGLPRADAVGVFIKSTHKFLLPLFGTTLALQDRTVMQFEPLPTDSCQANRPIGSGGHA
jgi:Flp pilus assembly pilin Flp